MQSSLKKDQKNLGLKWKSDNEVNFIIDIHFSIDFGQVPTIFRKLVIRLIYCLNCNVISVNTNCYY